MRVTAIALLVLGCVLVGPLAVFAQGEASSRRSGYFGTEASSGLYDNTEAAPRGRGARALSRAAPEGRFAVSGTEARNRMFMADAHAGVPYYRYKKCEDCHGGAVRNAHTERAGISCRQCHGPEPMASVNHFFSRLNPIRKHAYVCAKCHEGASASFGEFVVHQPPAFSEQAAREFKALSWVSWGMYGLLVGVLALFIPHTALWLMREYRENRRRRGAP